MYHIIKLDALAVPFLYALLTSFASLVVHRSRTEGKFLKNGHKFGCDDLKVHHVWWVYKTVLGQIHDVHP